MSGTPIDPHSGAVGLEGHLLSYDAVGAPVPLGPPTLTPVEPDIAEEIDGEEREAA